MENSTTEVKNIRVQLIETGTQKLALVKLIKESTGKGLKESKDCVDTMCEFEVPELVVYDFSKAVRAIGADIVVCK